MRRSKRFGALAMALAVAALLVAGCGGGVDERSTDGASSSDDDFAEAVDEACASTDASNELTDTLCDTGTDSTAGAPDAEPANGGDFAAEADAVCADAIEVLSDADAFQGSADDLDEVATAAADYAFRLDTLVVDFDDLGAPDEAADAAVGSIVIFLADFSEQIHAIQEAALAGDGQAVQQAIDAVTALDATDAEAAAQVLVDRGASGCEPLVGEA